MLELINPTCDLYSEFIDMVAEYQKFMISELLKLLELVN